MLHNFVIYKIPGLIRRIVLARLKYPNVNIIGQDGPQASISSIYWMEDCIYQLMLEHADAQSG
jgi:hypothetical protein